MLTIRGVIAKTNYNPQESIELNSKYQETVVPRMAELAALIDAGASDKNVAGHLGVSITTLRRYRKIHPELAALFEQRRELCDDMVESALLRRATGYSNASGKEIPPDVRAAVFWLQNRRPGRWQKISASNKNSKHNVEIQLSDDENSL